MPEKSAVGKELIDLSVSVGSLNFSNPIMIASGVAGYGDDLEGITDFSKIGAVVTKTLTLEPREGNPPPRLKEVYGGIVNSIGLANMGCRAFIAERLGKLKKLNTRIVVSVGGDSVGEYAEVLVMLEEAGGFDAFEVNISCPNVKKGGVSFGSSPSRAAEIVRVLRPRTSKPIIVKLTPNVGNISLIARACAKEGADAITVGNTFRAMAVNLRTREPSLGTTTGGLSGPAVKTLCMAKVWEAVCGVNIPVIACGGISCATDALEYIVVGAAAFQIGTACFRNFRIPELIFDDIIEFCRENSIHSLGQIRGTLQVC